MKNVRRSLALLLAMIMLLGVVPFALADEGEEAPVCEHVQTNTEYTNAGDGTHMVEVVCADDSCGKQISSGVEACSDPDGDGECDRCGAVMDRDEDCEHENVTEDEYHPAGNGMHYTIWCLDCGTGLGEEDCVDTNGDKVCDYCETTIPTVCKHDGGYDTEVESNGDKTHTVDYYCKLCGKAVAADVIRDCVDENADLRCDYCDGDMTVKGRTVIVCEDDGDHISSDSTTLTFRLSDNEIEDVQWTFSASGSALPVLDMTSASGRMAVLGIETDKGRGTAAIAVTATWADGSASGTYYVTFYDRASYTVYVKEGVTSFGFGKAGVFEKVDRVAASKLTNTSLYTIMTDGCATHAVLSESARGNSGVGRIVGKSSTAYQYDADKYNTYGIANLDKLTFSVLGQGTFKFNYELYEMVGGAQRVTTEGTISIVVGDPGYTVRGITYHTDGRAITFDHNDFLTFWKSNAPSAGEGLSYVKFNIDDYATGVLYLDSTLRGTVMESYKFNTNPKASKTEMHDLKTVTYKPNPNKDSYTETIEFAAYGGRSNVVVGTITIVVGEELPFTDVKLDDWFFGDVAYVYEKGIMTGVTSTTFSPNATLTRGMVVTMLWRVAGQPLSDGKSEFADVASDAWYAKAVSWAAENGIVKGMSDEEFAPNTAITREQLAAILYRYAKHAEMSPAYGGTTLDDFTDGNRVSNYAEDAMKWAVYEKIIEGANKNLNPGSTATRAEAAAMFGRFLQ